MKLYLSGVIECKNDFKEKGGLLEWVDFSKLHILQTFYSVTNNDDFYYDKCADFLMDSGAFSVMNSKAQRNKFDPVEYTKKYGMYIKEHNIDQFIELDIDSVYGMKIYVDCLHRLQDITGKDPVRVMHSWRGKEYFQELTRKKDFVCLGGIAGTQNINLARQNLQWYVDVAHSNNCKIHGLGIGSVDIIRKYNFDSIDSARWLTSMQFGHLYRFNGHELCKYSGSEGCAEDEHVVRKFSAWRSLKEWEKFSNYIDLF